MNERQLVAGQTVVSIMTKRVGVVLELTALKARVRWSDGRVDVWMRADLRSLCWQRADRQSDAALQAAPAP